MKFVPKIIFLLLTIDLQTTSSKDFEGDFDFIVAVVMRGRFLCSGTLITPRHVLTAGRCCFKDAELLPPNSLTVMAGSSTWTNGRKAYVSKCIPHEKYKPEDAKSNDIAVVVLEKPILTDSKVGFVRLDPFTLIYTKASDGIALVWKARDESDSSPTTLDVRDVTVMGNEDCSDVQAHVKKSEFCVIDEGNATFCGSDSGGPVLTLSSQEEYIQIGLITYEEEYCGESKPQLFTNIAPYYTWIRQIVKAPKRSRSNSERPKKIRFYKTADEL